MISPSESAGVKTKGRGRGDRNAREVVRWTKDEGYRGLSFTRWNGPEIVAEVRDEMAAEVLLKEEVAALDGQLRAQAEQMSARMEMARSEARGRGTRGVGERSCEREVAEERAAVLKACEEFRRERARYFAGVEAEVVKLALAIAARVLHREAKLDPLLLTGVVRVALEKMAEDSATVLRVPASAIEMWREVFCGRARSRRCRLWAMSGWTRESACWIRMLAGWNWVSARSWRRLNADSSI